MKFLRSKNLVKGLRGELGKGDNLLGVISSERSDERSVVCRSGFTLVELVIVIAIVIILSVVSVPIYRNYTRQAKMSEGYALLGMILSSQKAYYSQYGNFLHCRHSSAKYAEYTCNDEVLGIDARGNKYFTLFGVGGSSGDVGMKTQFRALLKKPDELVDNPDRPYLQIFFNRESGGPVFSDNASAFA